MQLNSHALMIDPPVKIWFLNQGDTNFCLTVKSFPFVCFHPVFPSQ
jgi:hypothetical protein